MNRTQKIGYIRGLQIFLFVAFLFIVAPVAKAQYKSQKSSAKKHYKQALESYYNRNYKKSLFYLKKATKSDPKWISPYLLTSEVYYYLKNDSGQREALTQATRIDKEHRYPKIYLSLANLDKSQHHFEKAIENYNRYLEHTQESDSLFLDEVHLRLESCRFTIEAMKNPVPFSPFSIGEGINTEEDEYWPSISMDESTMVFTRLLKTDPNSKQRYAIPQEDFYESKVDGDHWGQSQNMGFPINTPDNEGAQCISADGRLLFFTACNRVGGRGSCDIYLSLKTADNQWSSPINLGGPVNTAGWESQPSISADGRFLFFVSNRKESLGKTDIYRAERTGYDKYGRPIFGKVSPLNNKANTRYKETSPFIHPDGTTLYFSSDGWPSIGESDIYVAQLNDKKEVISCKNIGYPINTFQNDEAFVVGATGNFAYFVSDRDKMMGKDIYAFPLKTAKPNPVSFVKGKVIDADTKKPLRANIVLTEMLEGAKEAELASWRDNGEFMVSLPLKNNYRFTSETKGYLFYSENFNLTKRSSMGKPFEITIAMHKLKKGATTILNNIFFKVNSYELDHISYCELDYVYSFLQENEKLSVEIGGHTDSMGSLDLNKQLSINRARVVRDYLIGKGIDQSRITFEGYGYSKPIASNKTVDGRQQNRRTELKVIQM
ncbi:OmpA family protein [Halosquirtibacter laminarini]|uniref:OmpA family protein n=1 Tax=Halosquirtibacter laminarini TaxID=3374600 RepID=A0AC61NPM1_9BACT|nr:OmpA family protein [Prolixibacteraceae bacterium]